MEFVAIDVETANADMASVCQVGIAYYKQGALVDEWKSYINPEDYFDGFNISIHGITEDIVRNAPKLPNVKVKLYEYLNNRICVCHTHFDRVAIKQAFWKYDMQIPNCTWLDSAQVARRTWKEFSCSGYGLYNVCTSLGYDFKHHDALEDAKAAAHILNSAIELSGIDLESWLKRVRQPIDPSSLSEKREGNAEGAFYGEVLVFTGALAMHRHEAADMAASIGCTVESGVNGRTTLLVVGDQDTKRLAGHEKSQKHRRAEQLISEGQSIRILRETDFRELVLQSRIDIETSGFTDVAGKGNKTVGYSFICPNCRSTNTYYSAKHQNWCCFECGLVFSRELSVSANPQKPVDPLA
jgi:DNA polymerase-3 subunit epsilon